MSTFNPATITLDRRLLEHPRAYHLRRMRAGIWLYLDLLARLPSGAETIEVEPAAIGVAMGLPEGTVRSWLGHLRKAGYLHAHRLNGTVRVTIKRDRAPAPDVHPPPPPVQPSTPAAKPQGFTVEKLVRALNAEGSEAALKAALDSSSESAVRRALAGALAVPEGQIRRSRTALFLYLVTRYASNQRKEN